MDDAPGVKILLIEATTRGTGCLSFCHSHTPTISTYHTHTLSHTPKQKKKKTFKHVGWLIPIQTEYKYRVTIIERMSKYALNYTVIITSLGG